MTKAPALLVDTTVNVYEIEREIYEYVEKSY